MGMPLSTSILEFDWSQTLTNYFLILNNIFNLTILISSKIIVVCRLDIIFDFSYFFDPYNKTCIWSIAINISYVAPIRAVITRSESYNKRVNSNSITYITLLFLNLTVTANVKQQLVFYLIMIEVKNITLAIKNFFYYTLVRHNCKAWQS